MASLLNVIVISLIVFSIFSKLDIISNGELNSILKISSSNTIEGLENEKNVRFACDLNRKRLINSQIAILSLRGRRPTKHNINNIVLSILLCCGDIESDPGPPSSRSIKYPCTGCGKSVTARSKAITCDHCEEWTHIKCSDQISSLQYDSAIRWNKEINYVCSPCLLKELPDFNTCDDQMPVPNIPAPSPSQGVPEQNFFSKKGLHMIHINARWVHFLAVPGSASSEFVKC